MRLLLLAAVGVIALSASQPAHAIGCISGGMAGAAAGHLAHHGVLGAIGGCIAGHEYNKHQQQVHDQPTTIPPVPPDQPTQSYHNTNP